MELEFIVLATFTADDLCSPKPMAARTNYASNQSEALSPRRSPKENLSKSFIIRRRPISNNEENTFLQSQVFHYDPPSAKHTHRQAFQRNAHDDDETSEKERKSRSLPRNTLNIQSPPENGNHVNSFVSELFSTGRVFASRIWIALACRHSSCK